MNKFHAKKSLIAILLGVAVTGLSTSAFAATCDVPVNYGNYNWNSYQGYVPYVQAVPQYQRTATQYQYAAPQYLVPATAKQQYYAPAINYQAPAQSKPARETVNSQPSNYNNAPAKQAQEQTVSNNQVVNEIVSLVNQERAKAGLQPVTLDSQLSKVAMDKAKDMHDNHYFDHISPTLGSPFDMMNRAGIQSRTAGENIAMGQRSAQEVMNQWMNSQGHRENILNSNFTKIGVASYDGYWVQEFIG